MITDIPTRFGLAISHGQISIFDIAHPDFPSWDGEHVAQGFAWRPGHVSFGLPDCETATVELTTGVFASSNMTGRLIKVPLANTSGRIVIASVLAEREAYLHPGLYQLEFGILDECASAPRVCVSFCLSANPVFEIVRQGVEMTVAQPIRFDSFSA